MSETPHTWPPEPCSCGAAFANSIADFGGWAGRHLKHDTRNTYTSRAAEYRQWTVQGNPYSYPSPSWLDLAGDS